MNANKSWYASKGVIGALGSILIFALGFAGFALDENLKVDLVAWLNDLGGVIISLLGLVTSGMALWGRIKATKVITTAITKSDQRGNIQINVMVGVAFLSALAFALVAQGCSTPRDTEVDTTPPSSATPVDKYLPAIRSAASLVSSAVLNIAVSDSDRIGKANYIYAVAKATRTLAGGSVPSQADLRSTIELWVPDKQHWSALATSLSFLYGGVYAQVKGDPKLALQVLEALAGGAEDAAGSAARH